MALNYSQLIAYIDGLYQDGSLSEQDYNAIIVYILANGDIENAPRDLIQVRRGNELDVPNLAQGEFGFALDLEHLFIGGLNGNVKFPNYSDIPFVSVSFYGAKGDGITDDTAAIQSAINGLTEGGIVYFPSGTYMISDTLLVDTKDNVTFFSKNATIKLSTELVNSAIRILDSTKIVIDGLIIEGTGVDLTLATGYAHHGVYVNGCEDITIKNCEIFNHSGGGIMLLETSMARIKDNYLHGNIYIFDIAFGYAINTAIIKEAWIEGNRCESFNKFGIHVQGWGEKVTITNNHVKNKHGYGIMIYRFEDAGNTEYWKDIVISNNFVQNISHDDTVGYFNGMGIYIQTAEKVTVTGNVVRDVLKSRPDADAPNRTLAPGAISINGSREVTCTGNIVDGSGIDGIDVVNVEKASQGSTVVGNVLLNVYQVGIYAQAVQNVIISSNITSGTVDNKGTGINVISHPTTETKDNIVSSNKVKGGFAVGISVSKGTGTIVEGITVDGNMVQDVTGTYISISNSNEVIVSNNILKSVLSPQTAAAYALILNTCKNLVVNGNNIIGKAATEFARGLAVISSEDGVVNGNMISGTSDVFYSLYMSGNTNVNLIGNPNDRQVLPMIGEHTIGSDPSSQTAIRVLYRTTIPDASVGNCSAGSIAFNIAPTAGGKAGWICTSGGTPGTWKPFGVIDA